MKKNSSFSISARATLSTLLLLMGIALLCAIPFVGSRAQVGTGNVGSGHVGPSPGGAIAAWTGVASAPGGGANTEGACVEGANCETFTLTVDGTDAAWAGQKVQVQLTWTSSANEYDLYIHKGPDLSGPLVAGVMAGPGLTSQTAFIDVAQWHTGVYTVHMVYDTTPTAAVDHYHGTATAVPVTPVPPPPAAQDSGLKIGYENFEPPGVLTPITQSSSGGITYEYMGRNGIEPSVGANWITGVVNYQSDLETLFVTFDDSCNLNGPKATWVNRRAPTSQFVDSDPIGFTDHPAGNPTNRVFAAELTLLSPDTVKISHTDDDGVTWVPDQSGGIASAVDHETLGGGPYRNDPSAIPPVVPPPHPAYPNAVYYCSQDIAAALCSRSDDGGAHYGASVPIYNLTACTGLHGHVKVSPVDGTVYVPNRVCGTTQAVVVSRDNGATWAIHPVQNGTTASVPSNIGTGDDPAVGIDNNGRVYFGFSNAGTSAGVGWSDDFGVTWNNIVDVGFVYGLQNVAFPAAVGGSSTGSNDGRAAFAFYGSKTPGSSSNDGSFNGVWHLYVAHTFNGGSTWTTTDVTPNLPMQRSGLLRGGGADIVRNLADFFDIQIDKDGRVLVGYGNGCAGGPCSQAPINPGGTSAVKGNAYSATATIARQSSGRRLVAAHDPPNVATAPGMPLVTQRRIGTVVHLAWNEADTGNSPITSYEILRGSASGAETHLATVTGSPPATTYTDYSAADSTKTYYYEVVAMNGAGSSCANNEVASPYMGSICDGLIIHRNDPTHPEATGGGATNPPIGPTPTPAPTPGSPTPQLLIDYIAVGEPAGSNDLMFKIKVGNLNTVPPNSRWRIAWDWWTPTTQLYYVGMTSDNIGNVTFEYGTLADAGVPAVLVLGETKIAAGNPGSNYQPDGTITIFIPKSGVGNPQPGDLLGAIGGKTITGDTPATNTLERSTSFVDHTFVKGNSDNSFPAATYTVMGNGVCAVQPLVATSRKIHGGDNAHPRDIIFPLTGNPGVECRSGGANGDHQVVITFPVASLSFNDVIVAPAQGATGSLSMTNPPTINGNQLTINLTNVGNAQVLTVNLIGVTDGTNMGDVSIPVGILLGDVNGDGFVLSGDYTATRQKSGSSVNANNFQYDVNTDGIILSGDYTTVRRQSGTRLP